jgi:hypothetical protein
MEECDSVPEPSQDAAEGRASGPRADYPYVKMPGIPHCFS